MKSLAESWLSFAEVGDLLGVRPGKVHRLIEDRHLAACRIDGENRVPADFLLDGQPLAHLRGTLIVLDDLGFSQEESLAWLLTPNESLDSETPTAKLRAGRRAEVRRLAQVLG